MWKLAAAASRPCCLPLAEPITESSAAARKHRAIRQTLDDTPQNVTGRDGAGRDGTGRVGAGRDGMGRDGMTGRTVVSDKVVHCAYAELRSASLRFAPLRCILQTLWGMGMGMNVTAQHISSL